MISESFHFYQNTHLLPLILAMPFTLEIRRAILKKSKEMCDICGRHEHGAKARCKNARVLQAHHKVPECRNGPDIESNGVMLCGAFCHVAIDLLTIVYDLEYEIGKMIVEQVLFAKYKLKIPKFDKLDKDIKISLVNEIEKVASINGFSKKQ